MARPLRYLGNKVTRQREQYQLAHALGGKDRRKMLEAVVVARKFAQRVQAAEIIGQRSQEVIVQN